MKTQALIAFSALLMLPLAQLSATADPARPAIAGQLRTFMDALERADAPAAARVFTSDAKVIASGVDDAIVGREAIEQFWRAMSSNGVKRLVLDTIDLEGEGDLRFETGKYTALGGDGGTLGRGHYLLVWKRDGREWLIHRDIGSAAPQAAPMAASGAAVPDRVGFPAGYRTTFKSLGVGGGEQDSLVHSAYANPAAAAALDSSASPLPNGSVIAMEFARPLRDGEDQLLRDAHGIPLPGEVVRIDVMRREQGYGASYGESRAGEWEFASYLPDGRPMMPPVNGAQCASCHRKVGANYDFVHRLRPPAGVP